MSGCVRRSKRIEELKERQEKKKEAERELLLAKLKEAQRAKTNLRKKKDSNGLSSSKKSGSTRTVLVPAKKPRLAGGDSEDLETGDRFKKLALLGLKMCKNHTVDDIVLIMIESGIIKKEDEEITRKELFERKKKVEAERVGDGSERGEGDMFENADDGEVIPETVERAGSEEHVPITALGGADPEAMMEIEPEEHRRGDEGLIFEVPPPNHGVTPPNSPQISGRFAAATGDDDDADDGEVIPETMERVGPEEHVPTTALGRADPEAMMGIEPEEQRQGDEGLIFEVPPSDQGANPLDSMDSGRSAAGPGDDEDADDGEVILETVERVGPEEHVPITALGRADPEAMMGIEPQGGQNRRVEELEWLYSDDENEPMVDGEGWSQDLFHLFNISSEYEAAPLISMVHPVLKDLQLPSSEEELKVEGSTVVTMFLKNTRFRMQFRARGETLTALWKMIQSATYATDLHRRNMAAYGEEFAEKSVYVGINLDKRAAMKVAFMREVSLKFTEQGHSSSFEEYYVKVFKDNKRRILHIQKLATEEFQETVAEALNMFTSRGREVIKSLLHAARTQSTSLYASF